MKFGYVFALLLATVTTVQAEDFKHAASGLQFTLPTGWTSTEDGEKLVITNPEKTLCVVGGVIDEASAEAVLDDIESFVDTIDGLNDVEIADGPDEETVNGLEQTWYEGTGTFHHKDGREEEVEWDMTVVSGGKHILFLVGIGKLDDNEEIYEQFFESIKANADAAE